MKARRLVILVATAALGALALPGSTTAAGPKDAPPYPTCSPGPADCSLWHTTDVVVTWAPPPADVGWTVGCDTVKITDDTAGYEVFCEWWNNDGHTERSETVRRDATAPLVEATPSRGPDSNGWYNRSLTIEFSGADGMSGLASCTPDQSYGAPDSAVASVSGSCTDRAGNVRTRTFGFQYDATPPSVRARPDREPDRKGWYNRKIRVEFVGTDATSGISSCAPAVTYDGPDVHKAAVSGTCTDKAANTSGEAAFELKYDTKPPGLKRLRAAVRKHGIVLRWAASDASEFTVLRKPGVRGAAATMLYEGPESRFVDRRLTEGVRYRYTVTAYDDAGNSTAKGLRVRSTVTTKPATKKAAARPALTRPANGARVASPPVLDWTAVPRATYYNVQLFRDGKKILTAWPSSTSIRLDRSWRFDGRTQRLEPGRYRWYVWPGFGKRSANRYGKLLGTRTFVVTGT